MALRRSHMNRIAAAATTTAWQATEYFRHATTPTACTQDRHLDLGYQKIGVKLFRTRYWDVECGYWTKTSGSGCNLGEGVFSGNGYAYHFPMKGLSPSLDRWCCFVRSPTPGAPVPLA
ncbi:hypothetical protein PISMIDRAFT_321131 [Pisolithus microcarpus 441]|uniref:Uncharacterized protein n=1 Tax=Pisolithus microcarpus 441 TaxID=765257 RepID=A0A0C9XT75_9AGAM|nr:hypothetical protein BKA83DRAFT_321131 [Pisolithus microcarpus]KIK15495.1 hypothetical protein PISMIDRAFT_321131 [Pisolithus microcarpus 441]